MINRLRTIAAMIRSSPEPVGGGRILPSSRSVDTVPYRLSPGCALVSGQAAGVDHDGPVLVWDDGTWEPAERDDLPAGFSQGGYDRVVRGAGQPGDTDDL